MSLLSWRLALVVRLIKGCRCTTLREGGGRGPCSLRGGFSSILCDGGCVRQPPFFEAVISNGESGRGGVEAQKWRLEKQSAEVLGHPTPQATSFSKPVVSRSEASPPPSLLN